MLSLIPASVYLCALSFSFASHLALLYEHVCIWVCMCAVCGGCIYVCVHGRICVSGTIQIFTCNNKADISKPLPELE